MSLYIYCPRASSGAVELAHTLGIPRIKKFDGLNFWGKARKINVSEGDTILCWGSRLPVLDDIKLVNNFSEQVNKLTELSVLAANKVPTVKVFANYQKERAREDGITLIGRLVDHTGGVDLLNPPAKPDFLVKRETIVEEYRIHWFNGKSIRAGKKVPREGMEPHPWIRSFDGGWKVSYDGFKSTKPMRALAKQAINALELTFGAVDIGKKADGTLIVLEVNRAPGIEANTVMAYADAVARWLAGDKEEDGKEEGIE